VIAIVDYGLGNVKALADVYKKLNLPAAIVQRAEDLRGAAKIILPGVGSFDHAMQQLDKSAMRSTLDEMALRLGVPVLGICVGMQILALSSEEGISSGLGWIDGEVKRFNSSPGGAVLRVPHMGWNTATPRKENGLFRGLDSNARFYFLHSYYFRCRRPEDVVAETDYGGTFACAVNSRNVFGVQFHPEKSHHWGLRLLENFARL